MLTTAVVNGQAPPAQGDFGVLPPRKSQRAANLVSIHPSGGAVPPFNGRGIGGGVAQVLQNPLEATLRAMSRADLDCHDALALAMLDDLDLGQRPRDTLTDIGKAPAIPLATGAIGLPENLREEALILGFPIAEQDQAMTIGKTPGRVF